MNIIGKMLMISCDKSTELTEKMFVTKLSFFEKLKLKMHMKMCEVCYHYFKQSAIISKALAHSHGSIDSHPHIHYKASDELKNSILEKIKKS